MDLLDILTLWPPFGESVAEPEPEPEPEPGVEVMALSAHTVKVLSQATGSPDAANEIVSAINAATAFGVQAATIAAIGTTSDITAVPGSFADAAAVQTYLAAAGVVPRIESRLDAVEAKIDALIASLKTAGLMAT